MTRVVAVTGAAGGLGAAVGSILSERGDRVVGVDLSGSNVDADLSTADGRDTAITAVREAAGPALDGVVAGAGLGPQVPDSALIVSVNYFGAIEFLDGVLDLLASGDRPSAVAISSNSATLDPSASAELLAACLDGDEARARSLAVALPGNTAYCTSKRALAAAVRRRVQLWGDEGVRLNAVAPGAFDSPLLQGGIDDPTLGPLIEALPIPVGRRGQPAEVAALVAFLLSDASSFVHGSVIYADGGSDALLFPDRVP